jgi:acyl carrier protein
MGKKYDLAKIKGEAKALVAEIAELSVDEITDDASFADDLGVDSMVALEIIASIEKKYKLVIPEEKIPTIRSFSDVCKLLDELLGK